MRSSGGILAIRAFSRGFLRYRRRIIALVIALVIIFHAALRVYIGHDDRRRRFIAFGDRTVTQPERRRRRSRLLRTRSAESFVQLDIKYFANFGPTHIRRGQGDRGWGRESQSASDFISHTTRTPARARARPRAYLINVIADHLSSPRTSGAPLFFSPARE